MIVPFGIDEAYKAVKKIAGTGKSRVIKNLSEYYENLSYTIPTTQTVKIEDAYIMWVYACIFDDIAYNHDYSQTCMHKGKSYADKYIKARENIREEFNRKKILSSKYFYNRVDIINSVSFYLYYIAGISPSIKSELMKQTNRKSRAIGKDLKQTLLDLNFRLCKWYDTFNK